MGIWGAGMSEWPTERLADLCELIADCPHSTPKWTESGALVLRSQNIRGGRLDLSKQSYTDEANFEQRSRRARLKAGDLVITREAPMGEVCIIPDGLRCCLGQRMVMLRPDARKCDSRFLLYAIQSPAVQHEIKISEGTGSTVSNLRIPLLEALAIPHPPLEEQKVIANILGALDDKIELNRRMNETLEAMARAIFQSWFVDFDPVRAKASGESAESICQRLGLTPELLARFPDSFEDSELGEIPKGWSMSMLGELCDRVAIGPFGSDIKTDNFVSEGVPIIRGGNLKDGFGGGDFVFLTIAKADVLRNANAFPGDIVLTHRGTLGQVGLIPSDAEFPRYVISQSQMLLRIEKTKTTARYAYEYLRSPQGLHALLSNTSQVGVPAISRPTTSLKAIPILNPPMAVLQAYDAVTGLLFFEIGANSKATASLSKIRDVLLPRLLSGELEVFD